LNWPLRVGAVGVALALLLAATPAAACGCGGYIARDGDAYVAQERALIRWDGHSEDVVMSFGVQGSSTEAAWILPVPARASVKLADAKLFDSLAELTRPLIETVSRQSIPSFSLGGASAPNPAGAAVTLLERQTLGPFEVSNLAASDSAALGDWLKSNGYNFPPKLADALAPYIAQNWYYVAVRLRPGANAQALKGMLDPLWVTFPSERAIYPMRASQIARSEMPVTVYVLAEHRTQKAMAFGSSRVAFADWVEPAASGASSPLAPLLTRKWFLTKFEDQVVPSRIDNDFVFSFAPVDEAYHDVIVRYEDDYTLFFVLCCGVPIFLVLLSLLVALILFMRRRKQTPTLAA
jgi:hypothetical protein